MFLLLVVSKNRSTAAQTHTHPIMKNSFSLLAPTLLLGAVSTVFAAPATESSSLPDYLNEAIANDATVAAARLRWEAERVRVPASGALPDPELSYGYFISPIETRVGPQNQKVGLFQKIPSPARLSRQRSLAEAEAEVAYLLYLATLRDRIAAAKVAWIRQASLEAQIEILDQQLSLIEDALATLDSRFTAGRGGLTDRSLMRQQLTQLESRKLALVGERGAAMASLQRFIPPDAGEYEPSLDSIRAYPLPAWSSLSQTMLANSERLLARSAEVLAAEQARNVARLEGHPDITLGVEYTEVDDNRFANPSDNGQDAVMGSVRVSLPIWREKYNAIESSARLALSAARERKRATRDDLVEGLGQTYRRARALQLQVSLYENQLLPQTQETFEATLAGFGSGRHDALRWIQSQRDLLDAAMGRVMLKSEALLAITEIERMGAIQLIEGPIPSGTTHPENEFLYR